MSTSALKDKIRAHATAPPISLNPYGIGGLLAFSSKYLLKL